MGKALDPDEFRMSLGDHLEELRRRILLGLAGLVVGAAVALFFGKTILSFVVQPYVAAQQAFGNAPQIEALSFTEGFSEYLKISLLGGVVIGMPWVLWQLWRFVETGLYPSERKLAVLLVPGSALLTVLGLSFLYFIMLPVVLSFMIGFAASIPMPDAHEGGWFPWIYARLVPSPEQPADPPPTPPDPAIGASEFSSIAMVLEDPKEPKDGAIWLKLPEQTLKVRAGDRTLSFQPTGIGALATRQRLNEYVKTVLRLAIAFALSFQLPLVMLLAGMVRIVSYDQMKRYRRYALLGCFIAGAFLTPADVVSQCLLAGPLYVLYEVGLLLVRWLCQRDGTDSVTT